MPANAATAAAAKTARMGAPALAEPPYETTQLARNGLSMLDLRVHSVQEWKKKDTRFQDFAISRSGNGEWPKDDLAFEIDSALTVGSLGSLWDKGLATFHWKTRFVIRALRRYRGCGTILGNVGSAKESNPYST